MALPGISQLLAERLLKFFQSLHRVLTAEVKELAQVEGIGKKKAEKIIVELHDKIRNLFVPGEKENVSYGKSAEDAISALVNLGYKESVARSILEDVCSKMENKETGVENLIKAALQKLGNK